MGLNINKIELLPVWCITDKYPAFYDTESATAIEQTAKLYGAMRTLQEEYNNMATNVNATITAFINDVNADQEEFENKITKIMHDYIAMLDEKIKQQDQVIADNITYIKENLIQGIADIIKQMKESGELDEIITNAFNSLNERVIEIEKLSEKSRPVKSIEEMKAIENLKAGDIVETIGYYSANDGGGATYLIREKTESDIEDLGSIHFINDTLVAELIFDKEITPEIFGAKGDGETDDTDSINKTIAVAKVTGLPIFLRKFYAITEEIKYDFNIKMEGIYNASGFIQKNPNADILLFDRPYNVDVKGIQINNIKLVYETTGAENTSAMRFKQSSDSKDGWGYHESEFSNIRIDNAYVGIMNETSEPSWNVKFKNIRLDKIGYQAVNINGNFGFDMEFIVNGESNSSYTRGICLMLNCSGIVRNLDIEDWNEAILYVADAYDTLRIEQIHLERCSLNANYKGLLRIENQYVSIGTIRLYNCQFGSNINGWASIVTYHYISSGNAKLNIESISLINCTKEGVGLLYGIYIGRISGEQNPQCISLFSANGGNLIAEGNMIGGIKTNKVFFNLTPLAQ